MSDLAAIMLHRLLSERPLRRRPRPPAKYWLDEVDEANELVNSWASAMLDARFDLEDIREWSDVLGVAPDPLSGRSPVDVAVELSNAGIEATQMLSWRWEDAKHSDLALRVMVGNIDVGQAIVMAKQRRASAS